MEPIKTAKPSLSIKSVPRPGSCFTLACWLLLAAGAIILLRVIFSYFSIMNFLFSLPLAAGAVLLIVNKGRENGFLAAMILLVAGRVFTAAPILSISWQAWTLQLPLLLMLVSAIGIPRNTTPSFLPPKFHAPLLNAIAAALLSLNTLQVVWYYLRAVLAALKTNTAAADTAAVAAKLPVWYIIVPALLFPLGLVLLNLSLDCRIAERKPLNRPENLPYQGSFSGLLQWLYRDVGGKLQKLAKIQGIICLVLAALSLCVIAIGLIGFIISSITHSYTGEFVMFLLVGGGGLLSALLLVIATWPLYAFGQITDDVHKMRKRGGLAVGSALHEENPDGLPEL